MDKKLKLNSNELLDNENEYKVNNDNSEDEIDDDVDYDQITSNKLDKNNSDKKLKKRLIIILEHA
jgi:hypothetical protein